MCRGTALHLKDGTIGKDVFDVPLGMGHISNNQGMAILFKEFGAEKKHGSNTTVQEEGGGADPVPKQFGPWQRWKEKRHKITVVWPRKMIHEGSREG